jgi:hypothetical protein
MSQTATRTQPSSSRVSQDHLSIEDKLFVAGNFSNIAYRRSKKHFWVRCVMTEQCFRLDLFLIACLQLLWHYHVMSNEGKIRRFGLLKNLFCCRLVSSIEVINQ